jgi:hypothetical protein
METPQSDDADSDTADNKRSRCVDSCWNDMKETFSLLVRPACVWFSRAGCLAMRIRVVCSETAAA